MIRLLLVMLLIAAPCAQARVLKIATWNLEWLTLRATGDPALPEDVATKTASDRARLRQYADSLDADVVALEEVDGPQVAATIFSPDRYQLFFTQDHVIQRVGIAVKRGLLVQQNPDLLALDVQPRARFPLRSGADITLDVGGVKLRFLAVHLKTGCHTGSLHGKRVCRTLARQLPPIQGWIAQRREEGMPFVLFGDFNRVMDDPEDPFLRAIDADRPLLRVTEGRATPCWGGNTFIDHIFLGGAARGWLVANSLRVLVYREPVAAREHLSDHCPVSVQLAVP